MRDSTADEGVPVWSPSGQYIAFTSNRAKGDYGACVMRADESGPKNASKSPGEDCNHTWRPQR